MKTVKVFVSLLVVSCFAIITAGCAKEEVNFGPQGLADYAEKCGAEKYEDSEDWVDDVNSNTCTYYKLDEDGVYCYVKDDEVKDYMDDLNVSRIYYDKSIKEATVYLFADGRSTLFAISMKYSSKDDADDMYEDYVDLYTKAIVHGPDLIIDDFEDKDVEYTLAIDEKTSNDTTFAVYLKDDTVMVVSISSTSPDDLDYINDYMDDFCDEFDLEAPSELL